ncbi:MAG TPA: hypothetical protein VGF28_00955 [Thermoanaerobaculia bacterium]|jgi:antitoxin (DNA-binding transcriptional repressor) of toxin-antitoxin stability system
MTTIELSELGAIAERVKRGETVKVLEGGHLVATVVPYDPMEVRMRELEAQGLVRRLGNGQPIPREFYTEELPKCEGESVVEELIRARDED